MFEEATLGLNLLLPFRVNYSACLLFIDAVYAVYEHG